MTFSAAERAVEGKPEAPRFRIVGAHEADMSCALPAPSTIGSSADGPPPAASRGRLGVKV